MPRKFKKTKRKPTILIAFIIGGILGYEAGAYHQAAPAALLSTPEATIQVRFSPGGRCTQLVNETIAQAQKRVLVQAYGFTSPPIAEALIAAHQRGVNVKILVDRSQLTGKYSQVRQVMKQGISVAVDKVPGIAHNKVMIIDDAYVLTGSFNWTKAAEKQNAENLLLIKDTKLNSIYAAKWQERAKRALAPELSK